MILAAVEVQDLRQIHEVGLLSCENSGGDGGVCAELQEHSAPADMDRTRSSTMRSLWTTDDRWTSRRILQPGGALPQSFTLGRGDVGEAVDA